MARQYWIDGNYGELGRERRVIRICARATEIDPEYAQAWALMELAQANLRYAYTGMRMPTTVSPQRTVRWSSIPRSLKRVCPGVASGDVRTPGRCAGGDRNRTSAQP